MTLKVNTNQSFVLPSHGSEIMNTGGKVWPEASELISTMVKEILLLLAHSLRIGS